MNTYLIHLGCQLVEIRRILNWTQDDLAKRVGVSRPVVVNIEKDPGKMTKNVALALFVAIKGEIQIRKSKLSAINFELSPTEIKKQIGEIGITNKIAGTIAPLLGGLLIGGAAGLVTGFLFKKVIDDKLELQGVKPVVEKIVDGIESKLKEVLALKTFSEEELLKEIDNGEKSVSNI
jgi:DNA-binding XRE family transcriptional regulator